MDTLKLLARTFESTGRIVAGVRPDQMDAPTPCREWDVRALLEHAVGVINGFAASAAREERSGAPPAIGDNPQPAYEAAARATLDAWHRPGALEGTVTIAHGITVPAQVAAGINFVDTLVHGWDLARATGQDSGLDPELATAALEISRQAVSDDIRAGGAFGPAVPVGDGASPTEALVAFLGRQP